MKWDGIGLAYNLPILKTLRYLILFFQRCLESLVRLALTPRDEETLAQNLEEYSGWHSSSQDIFIENIIFGNPLFEVLTNHKGSI